MIIKNKDLEKMLKEKGRQYTITMYINRRFDLTNKQLNKVLEWKNEKERTFGAVSKM